MAIRIIYTFFLGLLLALFIGMGIQAFYPQPKYPEYPKELGPTPFIGERLATTSTETDEQKRIREEYDKQVKEFEDKISIYNRNVSIVVLGFAVLLLIIGLVFAHKIDVIADGLLLGGIFNLFYSIGRGFATDDTKYQFFIVSIGLLIALVLGYLKFIAPNAKQPSQKT